MYNELSDTQIIYTSVTMAEFYIVVPAYVRTVPRGACPPSLIEVHQPKL